MDCFKGVFSSHLEATEEQKEGAEKDGQIGRITKNIMQLLLLLEIVKMRRTYSVAGELGEQGLSLGKNMPWVMNLKQASKNSQIT
eukprot:1875892-Ditylum_brightwellii.AAC.1